jgi:UDP-2,3-diacylglucosamine pyrophosphatase LpxH
MSKTKFNGFEKWFLTTAIEHAVEQAEEDVSKAEKEGKRLIYAKGYFSMIGEELIEKIQGMTLKKDQ